MQPAQPAPQGNSSTGTTPFDFSQFLEGGRKPNRLERMTRDQLIHRVRVLEQQRRELRKQVTRLNEIHVQDLYFIDKCHEALAELGWEASYADEPAPGI